MAASDPQHDSAGRIDFDCRGNWPHRADRRLGLAAGVRGSGNLADHLRLAVDLSRLQFRSKTLVSTVADALHCSGIAPERLELEITESVPLQADQPTLQILFALRELGLRIALDDFGTGYSSLSYLRSFPSTRSRSTVPCQRIAGQRMRGDREGDYSSWQQPGREHHRGGCRNRGAIRCSGSRGMHGNPRLPFQPSGAGGWAAGVDYAAGSGRFAGVGRAGGVIQGASAL